MSVENLKLAEIETLAKQTLVANGCDENNASAIADTITRAERDGSTSHGLFRLPGYVKSMRSGKVDGKAAPVIGSHCNSGWSRRLCALQLAMRASCACRCDKANRDSCHASA